MRVSLLLVVLAALVAGVAAQTGCLAACNKGMVACLSACPSQCPADPACMGQCYQTCTKEETECVRQCGRYSALTNAAPAPAAEVQAAAAAKPAWVSTPLSESFYQTEFTSFVKRHSKRYSHDEFPLRYDIFKANYNKIRHHNMGKHSYSMAVNEFADMTFEEFHAKMTGLHPRQNSYARSLNNEGPHKQLKSVAASLDWRQKGAVTAVKNQQQCGSCWAFSTTGSVEGAHAIAKGQLVALSEQQLVDCSSRYGNQGCNGGLMDQAFEYIIDNHGITTESAYPYTARDGQCKTGQTAAATLSKYVNVQEGSESDLMAAVNIGPVSIAIEADQQVFQFYSGGILSDPSCGTQLDHGVLLVGYGTENGKDFWIVKNSWGNGWGEGGYIRLIRGQNECGLTQMASYPVV